MKISKFINFPKNKNWIYSVKSKKELKYILDILDYLDFKWEGNDKIKEGQCFRDINDENKIYPINIFFIKDINLLEYGSKNYGFQNSANNFKCDFYLDLKFELIK